MSSRVRARCPIPLFAKIADLKAKGVGISYISHKMDEIFRIADEITVQAQQADPRGCLRAPAATPAS
jgi:ABC-type molybdate transport system ATPase subunit